MPVCEICSKEYASATGIRGHYLTVHQLEYRGRGRRPRALPADELTEALEALRRRQVSRHPGSRRPARACGSSSVSSVILTDGDAVCAEPISSSAQFSSAVYELCISCV